MKTKVYRSQGCDVPVLVAESPEEYDQIAKREGACVDDANANNVYRVVLPIFRSRLCAKLEEETGIEREERETGKTDKDSKPITVAEPEGAFVNRVIAEKGWKENQDEYHALAAQCTDGLQIDPSGIERKEPTPKKAPKKYLAVVEEKWQQGKQDAMAAKWGYSLTGDKAKDVQALALRLRDEVEKKAAEMLAAAVE